MIHDNLISLARQGNADAITTLLNFQLQKFNATAIVSIDSGVLQVVLHSMQFSDGRVLVPAVEGVVRDLAIPSIWLLRVTGYQTGIATPEWSVERRLRL